MFRLNILRIQKNFKSIAANSKIYSNIIENLGIKVYKYIYLNFNQNRIHVIILQLKIY